MRNILTIIAALVLTACGGGGGDDAPATAAPSCTPVAQVRIQLFGDSTQEGYEGGTSSLAVITPAIALQAALDAEFGRGAVLVTVRAVAGTTGAELVAGTDGRNQPWPKSVDSEIVVVNSGINDMTRYNNLDTYRATLRTLATSSARVTVFETPNIVKGWQIEHFAKVMREVAAETKSPLADTYAYTAGLPDWDTLIPDWAHPSSALYERIGTKVLAPVVAAEVRKMLCKPQA